MGRDFPTDTAVSLFTGFVSRHCLLGSEIPRDLRRKLKNTRTLEGHFTPEAMPGCKEVTSQTVAQSRHIHLAPGTALVPSSQQAMQMTCDLHLSGSAATVPASLRQPHPALFPTLMIVQSGSSQHLVWDSRQRACQGSMLARTRVLGPAPCWTVWELSQSHGQSKPHLQNL